MTPIPVPHRWLAALLGAALLVDLALAADTGLRIGLPPLVGAVALGACAFAALTRPVAGALAGAGVLVASTAIILATDAVPVSFGIHGIVLCELIAGASLVVLVVWRCPTSVAIGCVSLLVLAGLVATSLRGNDLVSSARLYRSLLFGSCVLLASVGIGGYLRRVSQARVVTETDALIRKQGPLAGALGVLLLVEAGTMGYGSVIALAGSALAGACAFFAPRAPLRYALLGAAAIVLVPLAFAGVESHRALSFTGLAASMAMIAYAVRYLELAQAGIASAALAVANLSTLFLRTGGYAFGSNVLALLGLVLVVSLAIGWYFRARDRERTQTVRSAVSSAQQGERMALARELHDVVAHHVTGIVVQAQAALLVAGKNPDVAVPALEKIERSGTEALTAMRTLVGSLRDGTAAWAAGDTGAAGQATTDLEADIRALAANVVGPRPTLELALPEQLPHEVGRSVLRLVQESLTNVGKHAPDATDVRVIVSSTDEELRIQVTDDGTQRPANPAGGSGGYGLVGMRERVELLGGRFEAGPIGYVGWSVQAWLPLRKEGA